MSARTATRSRSRKRSARRAARSEVPTPKRRSTTRGAHRQARRQVEGGQQGDGGKAQSQALDQPAIGPFPARIESLATQAPFRGKTTTGTPDVATVVYSTQLNLPGEGEYRPAVLIKEKGGWSGESPPQRQSRRIRKDSETWGQGAVDRNADREERRRKPHRNRRRGCRRTREQGRLRGSRSEKNRYCSCLPPPSSARVGSAGPSSMWPSRPNTNSEARRSSSTWRSTTTTIRRQGRASPGARDSTCQPNRGSSRSTVKGWSARRSRGLRHRTDGRRSKRWWLNE